MPPLVPVNTALYYSKSPAMKLSNSQLQPLPAPGSDAGAAGEMSLPSNLADVMSTEL